jgi:DNA-binding MarR family transcriptional regulator
MMSTRNPTKQPPLARGNRDLLDTLESDWQRERPDLDASAMGVVGRVIHLAGLLRGSADQALQQFDLHYTDLDVLATLRRSGAPYTLTPTQLRHTVLLTSGAMTTALGRIEKRGLVKRTPGEHDRRVLKVALTPSGIELIDRAIAVRFTEASHSLEALSPEDRELLRRLLRDLTLSLT